MRCAIALQNLTELGLDFVKVALAFGLDQNFDAGFVFVVAAAPAVVDTHHGFEVIHDVLPRQELADHHAVDRGAAHAATHQHLEANLACIVLDDLQAHVVPANGGAVLKGPRDGDFELARQVRKLGVQRAPLANQLGVGPWIDHFVHRHTGQLVGGGVADAVAAGLDAVHVHGGQQVHHIGRLVERDPVELHVLAGGEVAVVGGQLGGQAGNFVLGGLCFGQQGGVGRVVVAGDLGQHLDLGGVDLAVGHGHAQHGCVALHIPAVLQAQGAKLVFAQLTRLPATQLVAELCSAGAHKGFVEFGVLVHGDDERKIRSETACLPVPCLDKTTRSECGR